MPGIRIVGAPGAPGEGPAPSGFPGVFPNLNLPQAQGIQAGGAAPGGFGPIMGAHLQQNMALAAGAVHGGAPSMATRWINGPLGPQAPQMAGGGDAGAGIWQAMQSQAQANAARAAGAATPGSAPSMATRWINGPLGPQPTASPMGDSGMGVMLAMQAQANAARAAGAATPGSAPSMATRWINGPLGPQPTASPMGDSGMGVMLAMQAQANAARAAGAATPGSAPPMPLRYINGPLGPQSAQAWGGEGAPSMPLRFMNGPFGPQEAGDSPITGGPAGLIEALQARARANMPRPPPPETPRRWLPRSMPFMGRAGFGSTGAMMMAGLAGGGGAVLAELGIQAAEEIAFAPQTYGRLAMGALGNAQPFIDLSMATAGFGLSGGFDPSRLQHALFPGGLGRSEMLDRIGMGPGQAAGMLGRFGIAPQDASAAEQMIGVLGTTKFMPGLAGMPEGMANQSASLMARYGASGPTYDPAGSAQRYLSQLGVVMEQAVAKGMDRASILRSIDASIAGSAARGGLLVSPGATMSFLSRFADMPGGRTGEVGMSAAANLQQTTEGYGANPLTTFNMARFAGQFTSEAKLKAYVESRTGAGSYAQLTHTRGAQKMVQDLILAANKGNLPVAGALLGALTTGQPLLQMPAVENPAMLNAVPPEARGITGAGLTYGGTQAGINQYYEDKYGRGMDTNIEVMSRGNGYDASRQSYYTSALKSMGLSQSLIDATLSAAQVKGVDPLTLGALTGPESDFGTNPVRNKTGGWNETGIENPWQVSESSKLPKPMNVGQSALEGASVLLWAQQNSGGDIRRMAELYHGPFKTLDEETAYVTRFNAARGAAALPSGMLPGIAAAGQAGMAGSATSFREMAAIIPAINDGVNAAIVGLQRLAAALNQMQPGTGWGGPVQMPN